MSGGRGAQERSGGAVRIPVTPGTALAAWRGGWVDGVRRWLRWCSVIAVAVAVGALCGAWFVGVAWAEVVPPRGLKDPRVRTVIYDPDEVVRLQGYVGYQIHLRFAPGETFVNLAAGDTAGIDVGAEGPNLLLKPKQPSVATNLTILTTHRVYTIAYSASRATPDPARDEVIYSLRFRYPELEVAAMARTRARDAAPAAPKVVNTNYRTCGSPRVRPSRVWDDGAQTHLEFRDPTQIPAVYVQEGDRQESLANFHVDAGGLVVHRVAKKLVLRRGSLRACVENRAWVEPGDVVEGSVENAADAAQAATGVQP